MRGIFAAIDGSRPGNLPETRAEGLTKTLIPRPMARDEPDLSAVTIPIGFVCILPSLDPNLVNLCGGFCVLVIA
jgi:hypothetical protein